MKRMYVNVILLVLLNTFIFAKVSINTDQEEGTYLKIGQNLSNVCKNDIQLDVLKSKGYLDIAMQNQIKSRKQCNF